ncbi:hypothetical protein HJG53_12695 [Sphingomonas sp. ID1715]|uniref:hypothetical protein n=1 Tax=Sphingomonas sp. ID1715 TaxID=1656898 RepID=UPI0014895961|nr:hypothetical protein [Sphingomonas sp. ID1715]NNM77767.1 hypothetical protein [Sphingomonas sp. ID1715]
MRGLTICLASAASLLAGCATSNNAETVARERAECQRMEQDMGLGSAHDHSQQRGMGPNSMNVSHERCMQLLKQ